MSSSFDYLTDEQLRSRSVRRRPLEPLSSTRSEVSDLLKQFEEMERGGSAAISTPPPSAPAGQTIAPRSSSATGSPVSDMLRLFGEMQAETVGASTETAPLMESIKAMPGVARAETSQAIANLVRAFKGIDRRLAELEDPDYETKFRRRKFLAEARGLPSIGEPIPAEQRAKLIEELRAEKQRLSNISSAAQMELADLIPPNQGIGGRILTSIAGSFVPTVGGFMLSFITGNPWLGMGVMGLPVFGTTVAETNEAGDEARKRLKEFRAIKEPDQAVDYLIKLYQDKTSTMPLRSGAYEAVRTIQETERQASAGEISNVEARQRIGVALGAFDKLVNHVATRSTANAAVLAGIYDSIAEVIGENVPIGIAMKYGMPVLRRTLMTGLAEALQETPTQLLQTMSEIALRNPNKPVKEVIEDMIVAAGAGGVFGAAMGATGAALEKGREAHFRRIGKEELNALKERVKAIVGQVPSDVPAKTDAQRAEPKPTAPTPRRVEARREAPVPLTAIEPTHRLDDGTPVAPYRDAQDQAWPGLWTTKDGQLIEAPRAEPIQPPPPNATWVVNNVPYQVAVVAPGRRHGTALLADGQQVPISELTLKEDAKRILGIKEGMPATWPEPSRPQQVSIPLRTEAITSVRRQEEPPPPAPAAAPVTPTQVTPPVSEAASRLAAEEPTTRPVTTAEEKKPARPLSLEGTRSLQLQNRLRQGAASVAQMANIAANPDYERLSFSKAPETGAPMVSIAGDVDVIPANQRGRTSVVVIAGERVPVQYAVVDANEILTSHFPDGTERKEYFAEPSPGEIRALNNGRAAGIRQAYIDDTIGKYRAELEADREHGIDPAVIRAMKRPVLVRVYPDEWNTRIANIGEASQGETLEQSPTEIALRDAAKIPDHVMAVFDPGEEGDIAAPSNERFVRWFSEHVVPERERGRLIDPQTNKPNALFYDRIRAAVFQKAYGSPALTGLYAEAHDEEIANVLKALAIAAPEMAKLSTVNEKLDLRPYVAEAAKMLLNAKRSGTKFEKYAKQQELFGDNPLIREISRIIADNARTPSALGEALKAGAQFALWADEQAQTGDFFGSPPQYDVSHVMGAVQKAMEAVYADRAAKRSKPDEGERATEVAQKPAEYRTGSESAGAIDEDGRQDGRAAKTAEARGEGEQAAVRQGAPAQSEVTVAEEGEKHAKRHESVSLRAEVEGERGESKSVRRVSESHGAELRHGQAVAERRREEAQTPQRLRPEQEEPLLVMPTAEDLKKKEKQAREGNVEELAPLVGGRPFFLPPPPREVGRIPVGQQLDLFEDADRAAEQAETRIASQSEQPSPAVRATVGAIYIDVPAGGFRRGSQIPLKAHYGHIPAYIGDEAYDLGVFVKKGTTSSFRGKLYIINEVDRNGDFVGHQVMYGYGSLLEATSAYRESYDPGWDSARSAVGLSVEAFRLWLTELSSARQPISYAQAQELEQRARKQPTIVGVPAAEERKQPAKQPETKQELYAVSPIPGTTAVVPEKIIVELEQVSTLRLLGGRILTPYQAAEAFQVLGKMAREHFWVIALDKGRRPIAAYKLFSGSITQTSVYPREIVTAVAMTPGVKSIILAHNHPSGLPVPSEDDERATSTIYRSLMGTVRLADHIIISPHGYYSFSTDGILPGPGDPEARVMAEALAAEPQFSEKTSIMEVPVYERVIKFDRVRDDLIRSPQEAIEFLRRVPQGEKGLLVLDAQNRLVAWWAGDPMKWLQDDITDLFRRVGRNNPAAAIAYLGNVVEPAGQQRDLMRLRDALEYLDVVLLDGILVVQGRPVSLAAQGAITAPRGYLEGKLYFKLRSEVDGGSTVERVREELRSDPLAQALGDRLTIVQSVAELPQVAIEHLAANHQTQSAQGLFYDGKVWLVAGHIAPGGARRTLLHEAVGHWGLFQTLPAEMGSDLESALLKIYESRSRDIIVEATSGFLKPYNFDLTTARGRANATAEWLAHQAELGREPTLWERFVAALRNVLRRMGFVEQWTDNDIHALLRRSRDALLRRPQGAADAAIRLSLEQNAAAWADAPRNEDAYIKADEYNRRTFGKYTTKAGDRISSRTTPIDEGVLPPIGSWRISTYRGPYGRDIEKLVEVPIEELSLPELDAQGRLDTTKAGDDARYTEWIREGRRAPPIEVVQTERGTLVVLDGHRRVLAAKRLGRKTIEAWVSYAVPVPTGLHHDGDERKPFVRTGLTFEMLTGEVNNPYLHAPFYSLLSPGGSVGPTEIYGIDPNGRLMGIARRPSGSGPWQVRIATREPLDLLRKGHHTKHTADTIADVAAQFGKAGLLMDSVPPPNLPPPDRAVLESSGRAFDMEDADVSRFLLWALHPRTLASLEPDATDVFNAVERRFNLRNFYVAELGKEFKPYADGSQEQKQRVNAVLELGRLNKTNYGAGGAPIVAENKNHPGAHYSKPGDVIRLDDAERAMYFAYRKTMDKALGYIRDEMVEAHGLDPRTIKTPDQILAEIKAGMPDYRKRELKLLAERVEELLELRKRGYVPFSRYGDFAVLVKDAQGNVVHYELVEWQPTAFSTKAVAQRLAEELRRRFPNHTVLGPMHRSRALMEHGIRLSDLDQLARMAHLDRQQYEDMRQKLEETLRKRGFAAHLLPAKDIPGYSPDFERSGYDYIIGLAIHLSRARTRAELETALGRIPGHKPSLKRYLESYVAYTESPREEYQFLRQVGFTYYIAMVPFTAAVNASQPWVAALPVLRMFVSTARAIVELSRGYVDAIRMAGRNIEGYLKPEFFFDPKLAPRDVRDGLVQAWEEGNLAPMMTMDMMALAQNRAPLVRKLSQRTREAIEFLAHLFMTAERLNRITVFVAAHRIASKPGAKDRILKTLQKNALAQRQLSQAEDFPTAFAQWVNDESNFLMGRINRATFQRGIGTTITQFWDFGLQMVELMLRMGILAGSNGKASLGLMLVILWLLAGLTGLPGANTFRRLVELALQKLTDRDYDLLTKLREAMIEVTGSKRVAEMIMHGGLRYFDNLPDFSSRIGLGRVLPDPTNPLGLLGIPADMLWSRMPYGGAGGLWDRGQYVLGTAELLPNAIRNVVQAYVWSQEGITSKAYGYLIVPKEELTTSDIVWKALGAQSRRVAELTSLEHAKLRRSHAMDEVRKSYVYRLARLIIDREEAQKAGNFEASGQAQSKIDELLREIELHNSRVTEDWEKLDITYEAVLRRVADLKAGPAYRDLRARKSTREGRKALEEVYGP